jgi:hypothetical protein
LLNPGFDLPFCFCCFDIFIFLRSNHVSRICINVEDKLINPCFIILPVYRNGSSTPRWEHFYQRLIWDSLLPVPNTLFVLELGQHGKFIYRRFPPFHLSADSCSNWLEWINLPVPNTLHGIQMLQVKQGKNPMDPSNLTGIASLLNYRLYSEQISKSAVVTTVESPVSGQERTTEANVLQNRDCYWCCCWHPTDD